MIRISRPENNTIMLVEAVSVFFDYDKANMCMGDMVIETQNETRVCHMPKIQYDKIAEELFEKGNIDLRHRAFVVKTV